MPVILAAMIGFLSAYALGPTQGTIAIRQEWGQLPQDLSQYDVFLAVESCDHIGREVVMEIEGESYQGLIFDCAGADAYSDGQSWMSRNQIAAEVDYWFWMENPHLIGSETTATIVFK